MPSHAEIEHALWLILWGVCKKLIFADHFGNIVSGAEKAIVGGQAPGAGYVFMYAFALQIYCDFSAYTDIARGLAKLFGIELTRNFMTPYFAASPSDFWQRWHISLSTWLRDYLYIPLGGNRHGALNTLRNMIITMFLGGLWHGAGFGFIIWGLYHGVLLVIYHTTRLDERLRTALGPHVGAAVAIFLMFQLVCVGWIFFRAAPEMFGPVFASLLAAPTVVLDHPTLSALTYSLLIYALPVAATELLGFWRGCEFIDLYGRIPAPIKIAFYNVGLGMLLYIWVAGTVAEPFLYYQF